ncbi:MAG TPA: PPA1309 family protein [Mycobacteriales bacterium]|jgi:hypothetical protein
MTSDGAPATDPSAEPLRAVVTEVERHVADGGWDRPPVLFALADTAELLRAEPALAGRLGVEPATVPAGALTPIEQEPLGEDDLEDALTRVAWPESVAGCALVYEALVLPPSAEADRPEDTDPAEWAASHPARREVRMSVGVLRDGRTEGMMRIRPLSGAEDADDPAAGDVIAAPDLAPGVAAALRSTLED